MSTRFLPALFLLMPALATAAPPTTLAVKVTDANGAPVRTAVIVFQGEPGMRHQVNATDGSWKGSALQDPNGKLLPFDASQVVHLRIGAPGYKVASRDVTLDKKGNDLTVALDPIEMPSLTCIPPNMQHGRPEALADVARATLDTQTVSASDAACLLALRAMSLAQVWQDAAHTQAKTPGDAQIQALQQARLAANDAAALWMAARPSDPTAAALCQASAGWLKPCS